jgi:uncharacterized YigZ family protein
MMLTLAGSSRLEIEIKRSRFVAHAQRVDTLAETLEFYDSVVDRQASHNCWAWRLDHLYRFNDDGEPSSTAGKPILGAIEGKGLDHVMVVVTRYFGGTKLGVGGLVRAYGGSAAKCIDLAKIIEIQPRVECLVQAGFNWTGQIYATLDAFGTRRISERHQQDGTLIRIEIDASQLERLKSRLADVTRGEARIRPVA